MKYFFILIIKSLKLTLKSPASVKRSGTLDWCTDRLAAWRSQRSPLIMVTALHKIDSVLPHYINQPMLLCDSTRPNTRSEKLQRLWFANTLKRILHNRLD